MSEKLKPQIEQPATETEELEREDWLRRYRESWASEIASKFHDNWRHTRLQEDGTFQPRVKRTTDEAWIAAHGTDQVDIANTPYGELPLDWQAENQAAARVVYDLIDDYRTREMVIGVSDNPSPAGNQVHEAWLDRNEWAAGGELDRPFDELPTDEQAKDIEQVKIARHELGYDDYAERRAA